MKSWREFNGIAKEYKSPVCGIFASFYLCCDRKLQKKLNCQSHASVLVYLPLIWAILVQVSHEVW